VRASISSMSTWKPPHYTLFVLDCALPPENLQEAKELIKAMITKFLVMHPNTANLGLFLIGTPKNEYYLTLNDQPECYQHLDYPWPVQPVHHTHLGMVPGLIPDSSVDADFVSGLMAALSEINRTDSDRAKTKQIVVITGGNRRIDLDQEFLDLADGQFSFKAVGATLGVVEVGGALPSTRNALKELVNKTSGSKYYTESEYKVLAKSLSNKQVDQKSKTRCDFTITDQLKIPVYVYIKAKRATIVTLTKEVTGKPGSKVKMDRKYFPVDDETGEAVINKTKALKYGTDYIRVNAEDEDALKMNTEKELRLIATVHSDHVPPFRRMGLAEVVSAEPDNPEAAAGLAAFIKALKETDCVALARFCFRSKADPKLVGLFPHITDKQEYLVLVNLPFAEDSRDERLIFPSLPRGTQDQGAAIRELITAWQLPKVPKIGNPGIQRFWDTVVERRFGAADAIAPVCEDITDVLYPEKNLDMIISEQLNQVKSKFELKEVVIEKTKAVKFWWKDLENRAEISGPVDIETIRLEDDRIGTVNPVRDFNRIVERTETNEQRRKCIQQMNSVIQRIVDMSEIEAWLDKAVTCLVCLKEFCTVNQFYTEFNELLKDMMVKFRVKSLFWRLCQNRGINIISADVGEQITVASKIAELGKYSDEADRTTTAGGGGTNTQSEDLLDLLE
jgi:ATP-dependent DNA helicase 2 subunit 2